MKEKVVFIVVFILSIIYIVVGNKIVMKDNKILAQVTKLDYPRAKVTRVLDTKKTFLDDGRGSYQYYDGDSNYVDNGENNSIVSEGIDAENSSIISGEINSEIDYSIDESSSSMNTEGATSNDVVVEQQGIVDSNKQESTGNNVSGNADYQANQEFVAGQDDQYYITVVFEAKILSGEHKGDLVIATQSIIPFLGDHSEPVKVGNKILLSDDTQNYVLTPGSDIKWHFESYSRTGALLILALIFFGLILLFGKIKGIKTIISLIFTVLAIFIVYIPAIIGGRNIYAWTIVTCAYITISTIILVYGYSKKTLATALGCIGGVLVAGLLTTIMNNVLRLTGFVDDQATYVYQMNSAIDLKAIIFGGILIGALGAIMDVSIDIASSLNELATQVDKPDFKTIVKSGLNIGKDIMGTMTNTLILAYIGSSLATVILLTASTKSLEYLFNFEMITVEILQALVGSIGILTTLPLTSVIAATLYKYVDTSKYVYKYKGNHNR